MKYLKMGNTLQLFTWTRDIRRQISVFIPQPVVIERKVSEYGTLNTLALTGVNNGIA